MYANKKFGQHFLTDPSALRVLTQGILSHHPKQTLEIGPGLGALTKEILPFCPVIAVEKDNRFQESLDVLKKTYPNFQTIFGDILQQDIQHLLSLCHTQPTHFDVVYGNLPYNIATVIILKFSTLGAYFKKAQFLVQKEVAERAAAQSGLSGKHYGRFSVITQIFFHTSLGAIIAPESFHPQPKVQSQILTLVPKTTPEDIKWQSHISTIDTIVKKAFTQRRKQIINSLDFFTNLTQALDILHISTVARAEELSIQDYCRLSMILKPNPNHNNNEPNTK